MASFKKRFDINSSLDSRNSRILNEASFGFAKMSSPQNHSYSSNLPEVYTGSPNRIARYNQYEAMELDSHISASLDIIAEFCTQIDPVSKLPFATHVKQTLTQTETKVLSQMLNVWSNINDFPNQLFDIFRDILKYGDQFFIRDPETYQWLRIYHGNVSKVIVNESKGKKPEQYVIKDLDLNLQNLSVSQIQNTNQGTLPGIPGTTMSNISANNKNSSMGGSNSRFGNGMGESAIDAAHVVHINMTKRGDPNWPFGVSILEKIFKSYKQKELLEDAILIYRLQRAPQRRVFKIDVGDMPENKAMQYMEQIKNSVSQRRIPSKTGGGSNIMDASYSPLSMLDDFFLPQKSDGRGSSIDTLPGGETSWGIDELQYFDNKLARGLRIPSSYLPTGPEDSAATYNDGKVGTALIQEYRFAEMCKRIQRSIIKRFDEEFKLYLKHRDINIDSSAFNLTFIDPQNFVAWRQIEVDSSRINNFNQVSTQPYFSKRWAMQRYLGLTEEEINKNHEMIVEENPEKFKDVIAATNIISSDTPVDLRDIGFSKNDFNQPIPEPESAQEPEQQEVAPVTDVAQTPANTTDIGGGIQPGE